MDSVYMGNILAQVGHYEWQIKMVGMAQVNRTGAEAKETVKKMKVGTYKSKIFQYKTKPLCFAEWSDNNIAKTLSNFHSPTILNEKKGIWRKKRGLDKKREKSRSQVLCPVQNKHYSETFHLINKSNGKEAKYDMGGQSKLHNWIPKIFWRIVNMCMVNAYVLYKALAEKHTPERKIVDMKGAMKEATHAFCQRGEPMRKCKAAHPLFKRDMSVVFAPGMHKIQSDVKGIVSTGTKQPVALKKCVLNIPWLSHQNIPCTTPGYCGYES